MNTTKTMRLPPRRLMTPSNKRKEREVDEIGGPQPSLTAKALKSDSVTVGLKPAISNQLLAGYLAHEFLNKGTLFGKPWDSARLEDVSASETEKLTKKREAEPNLENYHRYVEVANLLKANGTQFEGIVNPSQLARLLDE